MSAKHERLPDLMGGNDEEHYHFTKEEHDALIELIEKEGLSVTTTHEGLPDLLGGDSTGHYHLTLAEYIAMKSGGSGTGRTPTISVGTVTTGIPGSDASVVNVGTSTNAVFDFVIPRGDKGDTGTPGSGAGTNNHEELTGMYGGNASGHYHLTATEYSGLLSLLAGGGGTTPPTPTPPTPIPGSGDSGLPTGRVPDWMNGTIQAGSVTYTLTGLQNHAEYFVSSKGSGIFILGKNGTNLALLFYSNNSWSFIKNVNTAMLIGGVLDLDLVSSSDRLYATGSPAEYPVFMAINTSSSSSSSAIGTLIKGAAATKLVPAGTWTSVAYAQSISRVVFVASAGHIACLELTRGTVVSLDTVSIRPNPNSCAYSEVAKKFCLTGQHGVALSNDGETWSKVSGAPDNIGFLRYISDRGIFYGVNLTSKTIMVSTDGETWEEYEGVIPLTRINDVCYAPTLEWFCVVGTGNYAYFSKTLTDWTAVEIAPSGTDISTVAWHPLDEKFLILPTSGSSYYTFNPADWTNA